MAKRALNKVGVSRSRTDDLRREIDEAMGGRWGWIGGEGFGRMLGSRNMLLALMIWGGFIVVVSLAVVWTREQPQVAVGRVMNHTRIARAEFRIEDDTATEQAKNNTRATTARVYVEVAGILEEIRSSLENLPEVALGVDDPDRIEAGLRQQFGITRETLTALQTQIVEGKAAREWVQKVDRLHSLLLRTPILERETFQVEQTSQNREIELRFVPVGGGAKKEQGTGGKEGVGVGWNRMVVSTAGALNAESPRLDEDFRQLVTGAGFRGVLLEMVVNRLKNPVRATYTFDSAATSANQDLAATGVVPVIVKYPAGEVIYRRGEKLTETQFKKVEQAMLVEQRSLGFWSTWASRLAAMGVVCGVAAAAAGYTVLFVPRARRNPMRMLGLAGLLAIATLAGCWATATKPALIVLTGIAPTVFVTAILAIAYNQRVALAYGCLHGVLMGVALDLPIGMYAVMVVGVGVAVWQLKEVRDRDALIKLGICEGVALAIGVFVASLLELPPTAAAIHQGGWDALWAGMGGLLVSGVVLYILPTLERAFGLVTGMTLIELRDPKQPLLRQLQQRAPGTYNHSLNVASLGESAAEAIGADSLLTYVGALYHDIGKMNKPDYFIENQSPGFNRHDKLSPAMSLLVIVGHVKDGLELAREFNLPKPLHHFIEAHHGTTLVVYFYHRAKRRAEEQARVDGEDHQDAEVPSELEYRYPGPRPRTREAAILMICDAVESAARAMADPTPSRIDATVRAIANKRLMDGQFDECDLTLRELNVIVETVTRTLTSIYHGRIQYPGGGSVESGVVEARTGVGSEGENVPRTGVQVGGR